MRFLDSRLRVAILLKRVHRPSILRSAWQRVEKTPAHQAMKNSEHAASWNWGTVRNLNGIGLLRAGLPNVIY